MLRKTPEIKMWENPEIHLSLLHDERRNNAYKKSIKENVNKDSRVLDVGSGIGILTFFSVLAGAKEVSSVEWSDTIDIAKRIAQQNNFSGKIKFIKGDILKVKLQGRFNVITHELVGGMLWDENMLKILKQVRDKYLDSNGKLLPWKIDLFLVPVSYDIFTHNHNQKKLHKYGIDFSPASILLEELNLQDALPRVEFLVDDKNFLADPNLASSINLYETNGKIPRSVHVNVTINRTGSWDAVLGYFDIWLDEKNKISTYPQAINTSWGQFIIPLDKTYKVKKGQQFIFSLFPKRFRAKWKFKIDRMK